MRLIVSILFLFFGFFGFGQTNSLLYKISKEGHEDSYLYGTMHILPDSLYYFPKKAKKILTHCDELILEINQASVDQTKILELMTLKSGSAFDIFTSEQKDSVITWASKLTGLTPSLVESSFSSLEPFALMQLSVLETQNQPHKMVETELERIAKDKDIPTSALETVEFQLNIFKEMDAQLLAEMILSAIRNSEDKSETIELYAAYKNQDVEKLFHLINSENKLGTSSDDLLKNRNESWIPQIIEKTKSKNCFFAVGAAHLGSEIGVLNLLKNQGFTVEAIYY